MPVEIEDLVNSINLNLKLKKRRASRSKFARNTRADVRLR